MDNKVKNGVEKKETVRDLLKLEGVSENYKS